MMFHYQLHGATKQFSFSSVSLFPKLTQFSTKGMMMTPSRVG